MESYAKSFKVVLLGEGAVGKTSLMLRYTENKVFFLFLLI